MPYERLPLPKRDPNTEGVYDYLDRAASMGFANAVDSVEDPAVRDALRFLAFFTSSHGAKFPSGCFRETDQ